MTTAIKNTYEYPANGGYADTVMITPDSRRYAINTQYAVVQPFGEHPRTCGLWRMGGRCDCGLLAGIDVAALIADAITNGKFGRPEPEPVATLEPLQYSSASYCPRCGMVCYGDCQVA